MEVLGLIFLCFMTAFFNYMSYRENKRREKIRKAFYQAMEEIDDLGVNK